MVVRVSEKSERIPANEKRKQFVKKKTSKAGTVLIKWNISVFRKKGNKLNFIFSYFCQGVVEIRIKSKINFKTDTLRIEKVKTLKITANQKPQKSLNLNRIAAKSIL